MRARIVPRSAASGLLDPFKMRYPGLSVKFVTSDRSLDLAKGEADVAFVDFLLHDIQALRRAPVW